MMSLGDFLEQQFRGKLTCNSYKNHQNITLTEEYNWGCRTLYKHSINLLFDININETYLFCAIRNTINHWVNQHTNIKICVTQPFYGFFHIRYSTKRYLKYDHERSISVWERNESYQISRKNSLELIELSGGNKISLV